MIQTLDGAIPESQRPSPLEVLISYEDQRKKVNGVTTKSSLECQIAAVSCLNLERLFSDSIRHEVANRDRHYERQEILDIFEFRSKKIVSNFVEHHENRVQELQDCLVGDPNTDSYPYLTVLLLYRAGLHTEANMYCNQSHLEHVRRFGDEIYQKCQTVYGSKIPQ